MSQLGRVRRGTWSDGLGAHKPQWGRLSATLAAITLAFGLAATAKADPPRQAVVAPTPLASDTWVRFLGWSADSKRVAWRSGTAGQFNVPGQPCAIARLDGEGRLVDQTRIDSDVTAALVARRIHSVPLADRQQVAARDALVRDRAGHLWAGLVRNNLVAILYKRAKHYVSLWKDTLPAPSAAVSLAGFESPNGSLMALVVEARMGRTSAATLLVVPTILALPEAVSRTEDTQAGASP